MDLTQTVLFFTAMAFVAFLYSSVGHGGASGYLAVMALAGFLPAEMKPTALVLNIMTSSIASVMFWRAGYFSARLFLPLAVTSIPMAFLGGHWMAPLPIFHLLIALTLVVAAVALVVHCSPQRDEVQSPSISWLLAVGSILGFVSGLIGIGGGIFLTPLLLLCSWCRPKTASSISALFILVNSIAGLCGNPKSLAQIPASLPLLLVVVFLCGVAGSRWGSGLASTLYIRRALALGLLIAAVKMVVTL